MAINPQFPNYANGAAGTEVIFYTVVGGLPLYRLPPKMVDTGFGAALIGGGSTPYPPDSDQYNPPRIVTPGTLEGTFIEDETITHTPAVVVGDVTTQTVSWWVRKNTGSTKVAENVSTYTLQSTDVDGYLYVEVFVEGPNGTDTAVTQSYGPILPNTVPVPVLTANFTPSTEVGTAASLEITGCTNGSVTLVQVIADQSGVIQSVPVSALPVTVTQSGASLVNYIGQYLIFKVAIADGIGNTIIETYSCGPIVGAAPVISGTGTISGTATAGQTLTFTPPTVTGTPTPTVVYNWYRQGSSVIINTGLTYVPTNSDLGKFLYVTTVATNPIGGDTATSLDFGPITGTDPFVVDPGALSPDSVEVGELIALAPQPEFGGNPDPAVSWMWRDSADESRVLQLGGLSYVAKEADIGRSIVVASTATNLSGSAQAVTNEVAVAAGPPVITTPSILYDTTPEVRQQIGAAKATFAGFPTPVITSFGFWDYTNPLSPVQLVDGENVTTYEVKDEDFGKEIAFVTEAENESGTAKSVSSISSPVAGFLQVLGDSQLNYEGPVKPGVELLGGKASFFGVPDAVITQFGFAYENGDGTYTPIIGTEGTTTYTVQTGDAGTAISFYTTATNAAVPGGETSYSDSTGPIGNEFKFLSNGDIQYVGSNPTVGQTLSLQYAITVPRNQKNSPPGPVVLTWNWISDIDPQTPLTTPNAETYVVKPSDYNNRIGVVWTATYGGQTLTAQSLYTTKVGGAAPVVVTPAAVNGDVATIPSTLTLVPAVFSGTNVTTSWVWVDDLGTEWQTGGLTLATTQQMKGRRMQVKTTATNFAGSVVDSSNFSDVIGNSYDPVFVYDGTVTGPVDYYRSSYLLDPARAETDGVPNVVTWQWITAADFAGTTQVIPIDGQDNRSGISTVGLPDALFQDRYLMVRSYAVNSYGQSAETVSNAIGPMGRLPVVTQVGTIDGRFQINETINILDQWGFSNADVVTWNWVYSDDINLEETDTVFQVGGQEAVIPPDALGKYIGMIGSGSNSYGTTIKQSAVYGPVQPNPNPLILEEGRIQGDLVFGNQQAVTFLLPQTQNTDIDTTWTWKWDIEMAPGVYRTLQYGGSCLTLDWTATNGRAPVYGTDVIGKRISIEYTIDNSGTGGTVTRRIFSTKVTDCPIGIQGSAELQISGGGKSATGDVAYAGATLTCTIPRVDFMTLGNETNSELTPIEAPGVSPTVDYNWIYADFSSGLSTTTVIKQGCYPVLPTVSIPTPCLYPAKVQYTQSGGLKGVYSVTGVAPTGPGPINNQGTITIQAPQYGTAPTVSEVVYATSDDGSVWIQEIFVSTPGSNYLDTTPIVVLLDGVPITNQQFVPVYGFLTTGLQIVSPGSGYTEEIVPVILDSPYDRLPFEGYCTVVSPARILASNTPTITLPRTSPLPNDGYIGVSFVASGTTDQVPVLASQSNVVYEYKAPTGNIPAFINQPTIYGTGKRGQKLYCNATFGMWQNPGVVISGTTNYATPACAAAAEVGAQFIYPQTVTYQWQYTTNVDLGPWTQITNNVDDPYLNTSLYPILQNRGYIRCKVIAVCETGGTQSSYLTPPIPYLLLTDGTEGPSINWVGYFSLYRSTIGTAGLGNTYKIDINPTLLPNGESASGMNLTRSYDVADLRARLAGVEPDGGVVYTDLTLPPAGTQYTQNRFFNQMPYIAMWVEYYDPESGLLHDVVCRSNVIGTVSTENLVQNEGMPNTWCNPGGLLPNTGVLNGSGGWIGTQGPLPTYTWNGNGIQDTAISANPPVGDFVFGSYSVPYSAIDYRAALGGFPAAPFQGTLATLPTIAAKFNPNPSITPAAPSVEFYVGYKEWTDQSIGYMVGVQWDWRIEDLTTPGLIAPGLAGRWQNKDQGGTITTGVIAPIQPYGQYQLKWNYGTYVAPWYASSKGFQYSPDFGTTWNSLGQSANLVPQDRLRWALFQDPQSSAVLPSDIGNTVNAWWVVGLPSGEGVERKAPITGPLNGAWENPFFISPDYLGKMIGIEIEPVSNPANTKRIAPEGAPQYFWAGYCSTDRRLLSPLPPTV